jgi:hypothetical protein
MSSMNYAKTMEMYVQECIRQFLQGRKEEDILQEARAALGDWLSEQDKEVFLNKMLARAKVRLILSKIPDLESREDINSKSVNMLLDEGRSSRSQQVGKRNT